MAKRFWLLTLVLALCMGIFACPALAAVSPETGNDANAVVLEVSSLDGAPITRISLLGIDAAQEGGTDIRFALNTAPADSSSAGGVSTENAITRQEAAKYTFRLISGGDSPVLAGADTPTDGNLEVLKTPLVVWNENEGTIGDSGAVHLDGTGLGSMESDLAVRLQAAGDQNLSSTVVFGRGEDDLLLPIQQICTNGDTTITNFNPQAVLADTSGAFTPVAPGAAIVITNAGGANTILDVRVKSDGAIDSTQPVTSVVLVNGKPAFSATVSMGDAPALTLWTSGEAESAPPQGNNADPVKKTVMPRVLTVRSGPGTTYGKVGQLTRGAVVEVVEKVGAWSKIKYGNDFAYVYSQYIA